MAAQHEGSDVLDRDLEFLGQEIAEACRIEHAGHTDHLVVRQTRNLAQHPHHRIERIGDADDEGVGRILLDALGDLRDDLGVDADQVVAAHARFARYAGGHDDDVGPGDRFVAVDALIGGVHTLDRGQFGDIQALALGNALDDVEQNHVAQLLEADQVGQRSADVPGADECDFAACHKERLPVDAFAGCEPRLTRLVGTGIWGQWRAHRAGLGTPNPTFRQVFSCDAAIP